MPNIPQNNYKYPGILSLNMYNGYEKRQCNVFVWFRTRIYSMYAT
jgi:hypothetical protein